MIRWTIFWGISCFLSLILNAGDFVVTEGGKPQTYIVVPEKASEYTRKAAERLVEYIEKISGARLTIVDHPREGNVQTIWVGLRPEIIQRYPDKDFTFKHPEEIVIEVTSEDLIIAGRDLFEHDQQVEAGTYHAVSTFIQERLNVRWLWPGALGADIPTQKTIRLTPFHYRYHPQFQWRVIPMEQFSRRVLKLKKDQRNELGQLLSEDARQWALKRDLEVHEWMTNQRSSTKRDLPLAGPMRYSGMHFFQKRVYWKKYHEAHPDWFALQPDGTRSPFPTEATAKLCVSNPGLAVQWIEDAKIAFDKSPLIKMASASEADYGWMGYCVCENCRAWDNDQAPMLENDLIWANERKPSRALTDRYIRFWNILAKGLQEAYPDREAYVSVWAYHPNKPAPSIPVEKNIIVGFVGIERRFAEQNHREGVLRDREMWKNWWLALGKRNNLVWRPNLMARTVGGMPYVFMTRHAENMRFLADHGMGGMSWNSLSNFWAAQGPQYYLNAQLSWNPYLDDKKVMEDYYKRGFGPAAHYVKQYFTLFEERYRLLAEQYKGVPFSFYANPPKIFREMRTDGNVGNARLGEEGVTRTREFENQAKQLLEQAFQAVPDPQSLFHQRLKFVLNGFEFFVSQLNCIELVNDIREGKGSPEALKAKLRKAEQIRYRLLQDNAQNFAIDITHIFGILKGQSKQLGDLLPQEEQSIEAPQMDEQKQRDELEG